MSRPVLRSGSRSGPGRPPRLPAGRRANGGRLRRLGRSAALRGRARDTATWRGEQVRARGRRRRAGASGREREGAASQPGRPECRLLPGAPAPRLCCLLRRRPRGFPEAGAVTPAELGAGREPASERPGATVVAPRDRGARCLPRGASHRAAARQSGKRVPGGSFRRRRACSPPPGRARQVVLRGSFILTLRRPSAVASSRSPGEPCCDHNLCLQQNNNNNKKTRGSSKRPGPVSPPGSLARGAGSKGTSRRVSWAPRAPRYRLCLSGAARGGRTHSRL